MFTIRRQVSRRQPAILDGDSARYRREEKRYLEWVKRQPENQPDYWDKHKEFWKKKGPAK